MPLIDLLIRLRRQDGDTYTIAMERREAGQAIAVEPLAGIRPRPVFNIDWTEARAVAADPAALGSYLGNALFAHRAVFAALQASLAAAGARGTLRLRLDVEDDLHALAWETLSLDDVGPLATSQRILFSRYLESDRGYVVTARPVPPQAIVAVADPADIGKYGLARPAVERYFQAAEAALDGFAVKHVGATMPALRAALRESVDVLYLVCHGAFSMKEVQEPWLLLEDEQGNTRRVAGKTLAQDLSNLAAPPSLVVLVSCESAGDGTVNAAQDPLAALGPRLVRAGVPAVIAMRGRVSMGTAERFLPLFFHELQRDGAVDRALSAARRDVAARPDAWAPVLFLRLPDGRIFSTATPPGAAIPFHAEPPPPHFVLRTELGPLRRRLQERGNGRAAVSALVGMGGSGKSTLARALAHDPVVRAHFRDGVLWITLGQEAALLPALADRLQALGDHDFSATTIEAAAQRLGDLLQERQLLLVIDDAWSVEDVIPFLGGGPGCHVLITTRRQEIADEAGAVLFPLGVMDRAQAQQLLAGLVARPLDETDKVAAAAVAEAVGYLPLALELVAARVRRGALWSDLQEDLQQEVARLEALEPDRRRRRRGELRLEATLNGSLTWLRQEDPEAWTAFVALGVLPEDAAIAAPAAATFWDGMPVAEADELLAILSEEALLTASGALSIGDRSWPAYQLHDMLHAIAQRRLAAPPPDGLGLPLPTAHGMLLARYRAQTAGGLWHTLSDDGYIHRHLTGHLRSAGQDAEVHALLREEGTDGGNGWHAARDGLGQPAGYVADVAQAWQLAEADPQDVARQCRYALTIATLNSLAANVPLTLLPRLLAAGLWTPNYALAYVLQIGHPAARAHALGAIRPHLPDPLLQRTAREAQQTLRELPDGAFVEGLSQMLPALAPAGMTPILDLLAEHSDPPAVTAALTRILPHLTAELEEATLAVAQQIGEPWARARALALLGATWQRPPLLADAVALAAGIEHQPDRVGAFADVLGFLSPEQWPDVLAQIGDTRQLDDRLWIWAEARLLPYRPPAAREESLARLTPLAEGLAFDRLSYGWPAVKALKPLLEITPFLAADDQQRLWEAALSRINAPDECRALLAQYAPLLPAALVAEQGRRLLEWAKGPATVGFIAAIAPTLPLDEADPDAVTAQIGEMIDPERLYPLALLLSHLPGDRGAGPARAILQRIRSAYDVDLRVRLISAVAPSLAAEELSDALSAVRYVGDAPHRHAADSELADWESATMAESDQEDTPAQAPPPELAGWLASLADTADTAEAAQLLAAVCGDLAYYPERRRLLIALLEAALAQGRQAAVLQAAGLISEDTARGIWVTAFAAHLPPGSLVDLYVTTWDDDWAGGSADFAAQVRAGITPYVLHALDQDGALAEPLLAVLAQAAARGALSGLPADPRQHLRQILINAGLSAANDTIDSESRAQALARLAPFLPADRRRGAYRRALDVVWKRLQMMAGAKMGSKWDTIDESRPLAADYSDPLLGIGPLLPEAIVAAALERTASLTGQRSRSQMIGALAPHLTAPLYERSLAIARTISSGPHRAGALLGLAPYFPAANLEHALDLTLDLSPPALRLRAQLPLLRRMANIAPAKVPVYWPATLRLASHGTRPELLDHLRDLAGVLHALGGPDAVSATRLAVAEVGRWWP